MIDNKKTELENVVLVGMYNFKNPKVDVEKDLTELELLCTTAGAKVVRIFLQQAESKHPAYYIGKGKALEIADYVKENKISAIVFDDELSAVQLRNLEQISECKVLDRSAIILDIFASHAKTREAKTQVELAQYEYYLPRLTRQWTHLSKQYGGIGTKGPGETQIETDRRIIRNKISQLKSKLSEIDMHRNTQRKNRDNCFKIALVGYTNVGKSSLLNCLTDANVLVENKLFATLDSTSRIYKTNDSMTFLITDTVGFIKKLPHSLIASFRSTLKDIEQADLILHVADGSHPKLEEQIAVVNDTLSELNVDNTKVVLVINKIDLLSHHEFISFPPNSIPISVAKNINIDKLSNFIIEYFSKELIKDKIEIYNYALLNKLEPLFEKRDIRKVKNHLLIYYTAKKSNFKKIEKIIADFKK